MNSFAAEKEPRSSPRRVDIILLLILAMASGLRFTGLDYSVPFHFHIDEQLLLTSSVKLGENPREAVEEKYFFNYGSVSRFIVAAPAALANRLGLLNLESRRQVRALYIYSRAFSALCGVLTVLLVWWIAERFIAPGVGWPAAFLLAFSPLHVRDSHFFTPDILLTFLVTAVLGSALWLRQNGRAREAIVAGAAAGLAIATKMTAIFAIGPLLLALLGLRSWRRIMIVILAAATAFLLGNWPVLLSPSRFLGSFGLLASWATGARIRQPDLQFVGTKPWLYWLGNLLPYGAGPIFACLGLAGVVCLFWRLRTIRAAGFILAAGLLYFAVLGASFQKFMRISLPLHPILALSGGLIVAMLWRRGAVFRAVLMLLLLGHAWYGVSYSAVFLRPDPRISAGRELNDVLPAGTTILLETTHSNPPLIEDDWRNGLFSSYLPRLGHCTVQRTGKFTLCYIDPYVFLYSSLSSSAERWECITQALDLVDVAIIGPRYRDQYQRMPDEFPSMARFYRELDTGELGFVPAKEYDNPAGFGSLRISDSQSEQTFRLFDRPCIRVYGRRGSEALEMICENTR